MADVVDMDGGLALARPDGLDPRSAERTRETEKWVERVEQAVATDLREKTDLARQQDAELREDRRLFRDIYEIKRRDRSTDGFSRIMTPLSFAQTETWAAAIVGDLIPHSHFFETAPGERTDRRQAASIGASVRSVCDEIKIKKLLRRAAVNLSVEGHAIAKTTYAYKRRRRRVKVFDNGVPGWAWTDETVVDRPDTRLVDNDRFHFMDASVAGIENQTGVIEEDMVDYATLRAYVRSPDGSTGVYIPENVEKVERSAGEAMMGRETADGERDHGDEIGSGAVEGTGDHLKQYHRYEYWGRFDLPSFLEDVDVPKERRGDVAQALYTRWGVGPEVCEVCGGQGHVPVAVEPDVGVNPQTGEPEFVDVPVMGVCDACGGSGSSFDWLMDAETWVLEVVLDAGQDGSLLIRCEPNPYVALPGEEHDLPYTEASCIERKDSAWGIGFVEVGYPMQKLADGKEQQQVDAVTRALSGMNEVVKNQIDVKEHDYNFADAMKFRQNGFIFVKRQGAIKPLPVNTMNGIGYITSDRADAWHGRATRANAIAQGHSPSGRQTATEAEYLATNAQQIFVLDAEMIAQDFLIPLLKKTHARLYQFWDTERCVQTIGASGIEMPLLVKPKDLAGHVTFTINLNNGRSAMAMKRQQFVNAASVVASGPGALTTDWNEVNNEIWTQFDMENPSRFQLNPSRAIADGTDDPVGENRLMLEFEQPVEPRDGEDHGYHMLAHSPELMQVFGLSNPDHLMGLLMMPESPPTPDAGTRLLFEHSKRTMRMQMLRNQSMAAQAMAGAQAGGPEDQGGPKRLTGGENKPGDKQKDAQRTKQGSGSGSPDGQTRERD